MIELVYVGGLFVDTLGSALMARLQCIYPEGRHDHYFQMRLPKADPRAQLILQILSDNGWQPARIDKEWDKSQEYVFGLHREYGDNDLANCTLLELYIPSAMWIKDA